MHAVGDHHTTQVQDFWDSDPPPKRTESERGLYICVCSQVMLSHEQKIQDSSWHSSVECSIIKVTSAGLTSRHLLVTVASR